MGADLYLEPAFTKNNDLLGPLFQTAVKERDHFLQFGDTQRADIQQKEVNRLYHQLYSTEVYFRDSYNNSSLLWVLGLSWWKDMPKFMNREGVISNRNARKLIVLIDPLPFKNCPNLGEGGFENYEDMWRYFIGKKQQFIKFLRIAIKTKQKIQASI